MPTALAALAAQIAAEFWAIAFGTSEFVLGNPLVAIVAAAVAVVVIAVS